MIIEKNKNVILFIEPKKAASKKAVIDALTAKMFNAVKKSMENNNRGHIGGNGIFTKGLCTMGLHECICGEVSQSCDFLLENGQGTNTLCVHYLAYHRSEIPAEELEKVRNLNESDDIKQEDFEKLQFLLKKK